MEFLIQSFRQEDDFGVICENMEDVNKFCNIMEDYGINWGNNDKYINDNGLDLLCSANDINDIDDVFPCVYYADRTLGMLNQHEEEYGNLKYLKDISPKYKVDLL